MSKSPDPAVPPVDPVAPPVDPPAGGPPAPAAAEDKPLGAGGIKALQAERDAREAAEKRAKELQAQIDAGAVNPQLQQQLTELQARLDAEITARTAAEEVAKAATLAKLRTDRCVTNGVPAEAAKKLAATLTGETAEAIDAELTEWLPHLKVGPGVPLPNPQQGVPSGSRGGSLSAGRERFAQSRK
jgi:hypothetical protein